MDSNIRKELAVRTVEATARKIPLHGAILYSNRRSQYTSDDFKNIQKQLGMTQSLRGVDHCYDNARMESFFATLKKELLYAHLQYVCRAGENVALVKPMDIFLLLLTGKAQ